jgi:hypothetical protein
MAHLGVCFFCIVFKNSEYREKNIYLKLCLDGLDNRKQNWEYMFREVN